MATSSTWWSRLYGHSDLQRFDHPQSPGYGVCGTGGSLTGSVAVLIDNTVNKETVAKLLRGILRTYHRRASKASKVSSISTSLGGVE
jgi:hypothetical protein